MPKFGYLSVDFGKNRRVTGDTRAAGAHRIEGKNERHSEQECQARPHSPSADPCAGTDECQQGEQGEAGYPFRYVSEQYTPAEFFALFLECLLEQRQVGTRPNGRLLTTPDHFPFIPIH